jgi:stage II sporulation protein D
MLLVAVGVVSCQGGGADGTASGAGSPPPVIERSAGEPDLRIRVRSGIAQARLGGQSRLSVGPLEGTTKSLPGPLSASPNADGGVRVSDAVGGVYTYPPRTLVDVRGDEEPARVTIDGSPFLGHLVLSARPTRDGFVLDITEYAPVETYLPGVVVAEVLPDWTLAAFETQAIAARTYALQQRELSLAEGRDFDLRADTRDQAYDGATRHTNALAGVRNTRGIVLTYRGKLLRAYYSSTCGGRFAGAAEVWPTGPGYEYNLAAPLQAHDRDFACQPASYYRWQVERPVDELSARVRQWGRQNTTPEAVALGQLVAIEATGRNQTGRPTVYTLTDAAGKRVELSAESMRLACNQNVDNLPAPQRGKTLVLSGDLEFDFEGSSVVIRGRGFGHGVGMCQWCVEEMSKRGKTWRELLPMFYPGAKIERAY